jgi:hypothetical protein
MSSWPTGGTVASQVFYLTPRDKWYLDLPVGRARYDDITNVQGWASPKPLLDG